MSSPLSNGTSGDDFEPFPAAMLVDHALFGVGVLVLFVASVLQLCCHRDRRRTGAAGGEQLMGGGGQRAPRIRWMFQRATLLLAVLLLYRFADFYRFHESTTTQLADAVWVAQDIVKRMLDIIEVYCVTVFSYETTLNTFVSISLVKGSRHIPSMLLPGHMFLFVATAVVEVAAGVAGPLLNRSWPASFLFMWLALVISTLCCMTIATGLTLRRMMAAMTIKMRPQDMSGGGGMRISPANDGWGPNPSGPPSGSATPNVPRSDSSLSHSASAQFASQSEISRPRPVTRDASSLLLRRLTRFFIIIAIVTPALVGYQIWWVGSKQGSIMSEPMLGDHSHQYKFNPLQWVHLLSALLFAWFAWRPLSQRPNENDDFGPDDDDDDEIDRLSDMY